MAEEIWKDIKGYEGKYQVSNLGDVISFNYMNTGKNKKLKKFLIHRQYCVSLTKNGKDKSITIARLVAETFIPNPNNYPLVRHISEDFSDNTISNLEWTTMSIYKKKCHAEKRIAKQNRHIVYKGKEYRSCREMLKNYNLSYNTFRERIKNGYNFEEAIEIKKYAFLKRYKGKQYDFYGKKLTIKEISKITGIDETLIRHRMKQYNWNVYEAAEIPLAKYKNKKGE